MKKAFRIYSVLLLGCTLIISAAACGGTSAQQEERNVQERTIAPNPDIDDTIAPELPERPECPHPPKRPPVHGPSRLPHVKTVEDDDEMHEGIPVPYDETDEDGNQEDESRDRHAHRPPRRAEYGSRAHL